MTAVVMKGDLRPGPAGERDLRSDFCFEVRATKPSGVLNKTKGDGRMMPVHDPPAKDVPSEASEIDTCVRRLAALLVWLDQEHRITEEMVPGELPFYADPANLDAYAELLDASEWRTAAKADAREFFLQFAREIKKALTAPSTEQHRARVRETKRIWDT